MSTPDAYTAVRADVAAARQECREPESIVARYEILVREVKRQHAEIETLRAQRDEAERENIAMRRALGLHAPAGPKVPRTHG